MKGNIAKVINDIARPVFCIGASLAQQRGDQLDTTLLKELTAGDKKSQTKNVSSIRGGASPYRKAQGIGALL